MAESSPIQVLLVTDVPFWNRTTGAQQRIAQLINGLNDPPIEVEVLMTRLSPADLERLEDRSNPAWSNCPVSVLDLSKPPAAFLQRFPWYLRAIFNRLGFAPKPHKSTRLFDQYRPEIVSRFREFVAERRPDVIVFEYVTQIQLLRGLPKKTRNRTFCVVDTHDILWKRAVQSEKIGFDHWVKTTRHEEESALSEFDLVIGIQEDESRYFRQIPGAREVITIAMEYEPVTLPDPKSHAGPLSFGFLASDNPFNLEALRIILNTWPTIRKHRPDLQLVLAGSICDQAELREFARTNEGVRLLGIVDRIEDFYSSVDGVWNPVQHGTGLKIKNLEALAFQKCLVTSEHGSNGLLDELEKGNPDSWPLKLVRTDEEAIEFFKTVSRESIQPLQSRARVFALTRFGPGTQYGRLRQTIEHFLARQTGSRTD